MNHICLVEFITREEFKELYPDPPEIPSDPKEFSRDIVIESLIDDLFGVRNKK